MKYRIEYSPDTVGHLRVLTSAQQATVLDQVERRLRFEPALEARNRKPMRPNPVAPWELRLGDLRVYYDVQEKLEPVVYVRAVGIKRRYVRAVGIKRRNRVIIGGEEVAL